MKDDPPPRVPQEGIGESFLMLIAWISFGSVMVAFLLLGKQVLHWLGTATWQPQTAAIAWKDFTTVSMDPADSGFKGIDLIVNYALFELPALLFFGFVVPLVLFSTVGLLWLLFVRR